MRVAAASLSLLLPLSPLPAQEPPVEPPAAPARPAAPRELLEVAAAYAAKVAASALFVSGRTLDSVLAEELAPTRPIEALIRPLLQFDVDSAARTVTCRLGAASAMAVATVDLGCTLVPAGESAAVLRSRGAAVRQPIATTPVDRGTVDWPRGDRLPTEPAPGVDHAALRAAVAAAFVDQPGKPETVTRAVVVVHRGRLVAEQYAPGVHATMPLPGWSMSKTLTHALLGVRVQQGRLDPAAPLAVPEWRCATDGHEQLTLMDLLTMRSGLRWNEDYDDPRSDSLRMLFRSADAAAVYAAMPLEHARGQRFVYSSGSTNLLCRVLRRTFATDREYWAFPRTQLFAPLGMHTAVLETDASGTFVGSSYGFASARDWARLGMLYADDGVVAGERLLPAGWVQAAATAGSGEFGAHVWCNRDPDGDGPRRPEWPDLPDDLLRMDGHEGQYCVVFPRQQVVVVRLGCTKNGGFDLHGLLRRTLAAVGD